MEWSNLESKVGAPARRLKYLIFFLALLIGAYNDFITLFRSSAAVGLDGYYYVLQVNGLAKGTLLFSTHTPFVFYYLTGLRFFVGDTIVAIKVGTIMLEMLLCLGIGGLLIRSTKNWWLGTMGASYAAWAGLHYFMVGEFINNLGALAFIVAAFFCLESARQSTRKWWWIAFSALSFLFAIGSHRSAPFITIGIGFALSWAFALRQAARARAPWALLAVSLSFVVLYLSPYLLLVQTFVHLPDHLTQELSLRPQMPVTPYTLFDAISIVWAAPLILAITIKQSWKRMTGGFHLVFPGLALLSLIINLSIFVSPDLIAYGVIGRLQILMYLQVALFVPYAIWLLSKSSRNHVTYALAFSIPLLVLGTHTVLPPGLRPEYLEDREKLIQGLRSGMKDIPSDSTIVASHGDQYVIRSFTGVTSQNSWPQAAKGESIYWLLRQFPPDLAKPPVRRLSLRTDGSLSVLVKDDQLWLLWKKMGPAVQQRILLNNLPLKHYLMDR